ncbi:hypothetical protein ASPACDRAFT_75728 [Aspergillus aculeatus ATCC 16872]|uniref:Uncharacterized protein n=1 Tax=Aspergillus aculeatus (strain ATCC 16872 / CBS 172.66 / WB 5094) TaxID=690307 RepID=A0A1L9X740_ASPA1|nr:uncharacterized protein ASPACDRAFT_75728 [Aspergillus aculeatus ATCC 16872]OJK04247.1 hypothetical protein ASPACDRAFT_75728 [Aspergillus aculeatus ATCC 16872]
MHLLKIGALLALAQTLRAAEIKIRTTNPPANSYVSHCSVILEDELFGCKGSSKPFKKSCGRNTGVQTKSICGDASVTVDWYSAVLTFESADGRTANCTLSSTETEGHCNTDDPDAFPVEHNGAGRLLGPHTVFWGVAPVVAGLLL